MERKALIKTIERYAQARGIMPSTLCQYAIQNRKFYERLLGGYYHERQARRIKEWIADNPPQAAGNCAA